MLSGRRSRRVVPARRSLVAPLRAAGDGRRAAGDHLRQRRQPAGRACERPRARDCGAHRARRRTLARGSAAADRDVAAVARSAARSACSSPRGAATCCSAMFTGGAAIIDLDTRFDWRVLLFAVSVTMICGLAAGILPALRSTRIAPTEAIKAQARQVGHAGGRRGALVGKSLVTAQMAFCLLLLVVAGLFIRSMQALVAHRRRLRSRSPARGADGRAQHGLLGRAASGAVRPRARAPPAHPWRGVGQPVAQRSARHVLARQQPDRSRAIRRRRTNG